MQPLASLPREGFPRDLDQPEPEPDANAEGSGRGRLRVVGIVALVTAVVAAAVVVGAFALGGSDDAPEAASQPGTTVTTASPTTTPAPTGAPEEILRTMLNPETLSGCGTAPNIDNQWADARLICTGPQGLLVNAYHFPSQSALDRQVGALATYIVDDGDCDDGRSSIEEWSTPQEPTGGVRLCYYYVDNFVIYWFYESDRISFSVEQPDPAQLVTWWHSFDPVLH